MFESQAGHFHLVYYFLVRRDHLTFYLVFHWFAEDVVCVDMDYDHDIPVAALQGEWESSCLVLVDGVGKVHNLDENVVMSLDLGW